MAYPYAYDVFVSFRGEDCRHRFLSHLHKALARYGIKTFKDDESLERGKSISPEIKKSIHESRLSVIVFSEHYASSSWCLEELVEIMHCRDVKEQIVLPIFLDVDPSEVSHQRGSFGQAFFEHEKKLKCPHICTSSTKKVERGIVKHSSVDADSDHGDESRLEMQDIQSWRSCLTKVAEIAGWDSRENEDEAKFIDEITIDVMKKLTRISSKQSSELVGMDSRIEEIHERLALGYDDVRMVGICGIGGIGKTTIARFLYHQISGRFDGCCFLDNVRENMQRHGLNHLQEQLVKKVTSGIRKLRHVVSTLQSRHITVLIVLDDVDDIQQLKELARGHDWFGPGSRIIITTRDKNLLRAHGIYEIYDVARLNDFESLQLFYNHAFRDRHATDEFMRLAPQFANHTRGLPLVVKVLGSSLLDKSLSEWENELKDLHRNNWEVSNLLRICFQRLDALQKRIFHDIACFFKGDEADYVTKCLDVCGISAEFKNLCDKCFISVTDKRIWIHDLMQEIVHDVCNEDATCSRLWDSEDVKHALSGIKSIEKVEIMILDSSKINDVLILPVVISEMSSLRLLKIYSSPNSHSNTQRALRGLQSIGVRLLVDFPSEVICFHWEGYPLRHLPSDFYPKNLFELYMPRSYLKKLPTNMECFDKLKFIDLSDSVNLTKTPNFSKTPNLEHLILKGCTNLTKVHHSIAFHKSLQLVNMKVCTSLCEFPSPIEMKALKYFILSGCSKIQEFPEIRGEMECLLQLYVDGTAIKRLPESSKELTGLRVLFVEERQDLNILAAIGCSGKLQIKKVTTGGRKEKPRWRKWGLDKYATVTAAATATVTAAATAIVMGIVLESRHKHAECTRQNDIQEDKTKNEKTEMWG